MKIGIIGGSGLDDPKILQDFKEIEVNTIYGNPSSALTVGKISNKEVAILARHGKKHTINPSNVNYRANIDALKKVGCTYILATTACGSLREEIKPGTIVFPSQFIDFTKKRHYTFYDNDQVCHISMEDPFCKKLRGLLIETAKELELPYHTNKTIISIEGSRFSTRAESNLFRMFGADIINMSLVPEVILAREAGICYQSIAMSTDYDCWKSDKENVTWEQISKVMQKNTENVKKLLINVIPKIDYKDCNCKTAINLALV